MSFVKLADKKLNSFFDSYLYLLLMTIVVFVFWVTKLDFAGLTAVLSLIALSLLFSRNSFNAMLSLCLMFFLFSDTAIDFEGHYGWFALLALPIIGMIVNFIRFGARVQWKGFSFAVLLLMVPWALQGIGRSSRNTMLALACVGIALLYTLIYFFFNASLRHEEGKRLLEKTAYFLVVLGILIAVQTIVFYARMGGSLESILDRMDGVRLELGWGRRNNIACLLGLCIPVNFYFAVKKGWWRVIFIAVAIFETVLLISMQSRGATIITLLVLPFVAIYTLCATNNKKAVLLFYAVAVAALAILAFFYSKYLEILFSRLVDSGLSDLGNGRFSLYDEGWRAFVQHPIFGTGFDYRFGEWTGSNGAYDYHDTVVQIYACFGIVGGLFYGYFYYWRYRVILTGWQPVKLFIFAGLMIAELYSLLDTCYFQPMNYFIFLTITLACENALKPSEAEPFLLHALKMRKERKKEYQAVNS